MEYKQDRRVLALDWGTRRIGVAISDELGLTAQPLTTLPGHDWEQLINAVRDLCLQYDVGIIVVGIPLNMDGSAGPAAGRARALALRLHQELQLPVIEWDERLTSAAADRVLLAADTSRRRRKVVRDQLAAALILQSYLDSRR